MNSVKLHGTRVPNNSSQWNVKQDTNHLNNVLPGAVARSEACPLGMQAAPGSIPTSGTFFRGDLVMKNFYRHSPSSADSRRAVVSYWRKNVH